LRRRSAHVAVFRTSAAQGCATSARKTWRLEPLQVMLTDSFKREVTEHANAQFMNDLVHDHEHDWTWLPQLMVDSVRYKFMFYGNDEMNGCVYPCQNRNVLAITRKARRTTKVVPTGARVIERIPVGFHNSSWGMRSSLRG